MSTFPLFVTILAVLLLGGGYWIFAEKIPNSSAEVSQMPVTSGENPEPGSSVHDLPVEPAAAKAR